MKRSKKPAVAEEQEEAKNEEAVAGGRVVKRPDGFYWQSRSGEESGPFATREEAGENSDADADDPEALHQAESELGISEWIDPDSGEPAEDSVPRIEDH